MGVDINKYDHWFLSLPRASRKQLLSDLHELRIAARDYNRDMAFLPAVVTAAGKLGRTLPKGIWDLFDRTKLNSMENFAKVLIDNFEKHHSMIDPIIDDVLNV